MKQIFPVVLIALGLALLFGVAGWFYFEGLVAHPAALPLPEWVADLPMTGFQSGDEAAAAFVNLHGKQFPLTSGAIGLYGDNQITLWVAGAPANFIAARMIVAMRDKIANGNSPFTPMTEINDNGRIVYVLEGVGQKHYYFQSKNLVVWLAVNPAFADAAIQQILEVYP
ncbi:MAG: hypothetical protein AB1750_06660 [Chloroflexota bacterium]